MKASQTDRQIDQEPSIAISLLLGSTELLFLEAPNVNSSTVGRAKIEVVPPIPSKGETVTGLVVFGKPKLNDGSIDEENTGRPWELLSFDPKILSSYSCNWWYISTFHEHKRNGTSLSKKK